MAYCWKEEFEVCDEGGGGVAWFDDDELAIDCAKGSTGHYVVKLSHYQTERETVWPDDEDRY